MSSGKIIASSHVRSQPKCTVAIRDTVHTRQPAHAMQACALPGAGRGIMRVREGPLCMRAGNLRLRACTGKTVVQAMADGAPAAASSLDWLVAAALRQRRRCLSE